MKGGAAPAPLAATYSVVARDPVTGQLGVGVQSRAFAAGRIVPWARPGVGAVATQALSAVRHGPDGIELMRSGLTAGQALAAVVAGDESRELRQVAMVDARGNAAAHTGKSCVQAALHVVGEGFSAQGNMLAGPPVIEELAGAFASSGGPLAERLLAGLDAAEAAGGDARGRQAAGLLVVSGDPAEPWYAQQVNLRVDDHAAPLTELRRLLGVQRTRERFGDLRVRLERGDLGAWQEFRADPIPDPEIRLYLAAALWPHRRDEARDQFRALFGEHPRWREVARAFAVAGRIKLDLAELP